MIRIISCLVCLVSFSFPLCFAQEQPHVALVGWDLSDAGKDIADSSGQVLRGMGISFDRLSGQDLSNAAVLMEYDLLVYAGAEVLPVSAVSSLEKYMGAGKNLVVLGAPPFSKKLWNTEDGLLSQEEVNREIAGQSAAHKIFDFESAAQREGWMRDCNDPKTDSAVRFLQEGQDRFLRCDMDQVSGWDLFSHSVGGIGRDDLVLRCRVRGENIQRLMVELVENNGSRWIAIVPVSSEWDRVLLFPKDFDYWQGGVPVSDQERVRQVRFSQVKKIRFGEGISHVKPFALRHQFDVDDIDLAENPVAREFVREMLPKQALTPEYKFFPVSSAVNIEEAPGQTFVHDLGRIQAEGIVSTFPSPMGSGYLKHRTSRFVPLVNTYDERGYRSGYLAWMVLNSGPKDVNRYSGGVWTVFGLSHPESYRQPSLRKAFQQVVQVMLQDTYLVEGGSEYFFYLGEPETVLLGAHSFVGSKEKVPDSLSLCWTVTDPVNKKVLFQHGQSLYRQGSRLPEREGSLLNNFQVCTFESKLAAGTYRIQTELLRGDQVIDRIVHEVNVRNLKSIDACNFVKNDNGNFILDEKPWFAFGINYMPSSCAAQEDGKLFEYYVGQSAYDPAIVDEDLKILHDIGFNMISVFIHHQDLESWNMLDLIARAEKYGMKVNLSLRTGADPMQFNPSDVEDFIVQYGLDRNDTVMSYDLAWEINWGQWDVSYGTGTGRKGHDVSWALWINDQYGSVENAEQIWGIAVPRKVDGNITGPSDKWLRNDGAWRKLVAAYRSFVDSYSGFRMMKAVDAIRKLDPNHLISFRMHMTGDPTQDPAVYPYDMKGMAPFLDIMEPEAYGRIGDWEKVKPGLFTVAYGRMVAPTKPLIWSEFGYHIWSGSNFATDEERRTFQADFYRNFLTMCQKGHVNGVVCWYSVAGLRINENSDYGILNPDKSDRPVTRILREYAPIMKKAARVPKPTAYLSFDRDSSSRGINDEYTRLKDEFWALTEKGQYVGLTSEGIGKTSANVSVTPVGSGSGSQSGPSKYLNAVFRHVQVCQDGQSWITVRNGDLVPVVSGLPVKIRAEITNTDYAEWLSSTESAGEVLLEVCSEKDVLCRTALTQNTSYLEDGRFKEVELTGMSEKTNLRMQLTAAGRRNFGEVFHLKLMPQ